VYLVVSEALANAAKHSQASLVEVTGRAEDGVLRLTVHDDGVGGAQRNGGLGIPGMTDRVAALGGRLDLDSPPGAGTTVTLSVPCAHLEEG
jgi:signal transduction histidine kinase